MAGKFGIHINPDLILKLTEPDRYPPPPLFPVKKPPVPPKSDTPRKPSPPPPPPPPPDTLPPPLPPSDASLQPLRLVISDCEQLLSRLQSQEIAERDAVRARARELQATRYQAPPPTPPPCPLEKQACISCFAEHPGDPLKCQHSVQAYALCAERVRQRFISSGFSRPQVLS